MEKVQFFSNGIISKDMEMSGEGRVEKELRDMSFEISPTWIFKSLRIIKADILGIRRLIQNYIFKE